MDVRWPLSDTCAGRVEKNVVGQYGVVLRVVASHPAAGIVNRRGNRSRGWEMVGEPRTPKPQPKMDLGNP